MVVLLFDSMHVITRQPNSTIKSYRQAAMSTPYHNSTQHQLTPRVEAAAEAVIYHRKSNADANASVGRDNFKYGVEDGERDRILYEMLRLDDHNEQDGQDEPPQVMGELPTDLVADKANPTLFSLFRRNANTVPLRKRNTNHSAQGMDLATGLSVRDGTSKDVVIARILTVDPQRSFLVDI
ncbi:hypothetical protein Hte_009372 [Hypoxylon texense]